MHAIRRNLNTIVDYFFLLYIHEPRKRHEMRIFLKIPPKKTCQRRQKRTVRRHCPCSHSPVFGIDSMSVLPFFSRLLAFHSSFDVIREFSQSRKKWCFCLPPLCSFDSCHITKWNLKPKIINTPAQAAKNCKNNKTHKMKEKRAQIFGIVGIRREREREKNNSFRKCDAPKVQLFFFL